MNIPEVKALLDEWFTHYDFSGAKGPALVGQCFVPNAEAQAAVKEKTASMGA